MHPTHRSMKGDNIGPSSHKNNYTCGVLLGNWLEERIPKDSTSSSFKSNGPWSFPASTTKTHFVAKSVIPRTMNRQPDMGRDLLFGQATDGSATQTEANPSKTIDALQKKRAQWRQERDPDAEPMQSTTHFSLASAARAIATEEPSPKQSRKTNFTASCVQEHNVLGFRK